MSLYFVTGATGVVGSAVCNHLFKSTSSSLILLIRANDRADLAARLDQVVGYCGLNPETCSRRVTAVMGDTAKPKLGMNGGDYQRVADSVSNVIHCAGAVRMNQSIDEARKSAVFSVRNVIQLVQDAKRTSGAFPKAEIVSTVGVGGRVPGEVPERWLNESRSFHNTYEQSKAEAEVLIEQAVLRGLPITVHRPSMVVGDSRNGKVMHFQVFYHLAEFLTGLRTLGLLPNPGTTKLDVVASDHVAEAIVRSSMTSHSAGRLLHLAAGPEGALPIRDLQSIVHTRFVESGIRVPRVKTVPLWFFRALIPAVKGLSSARTRRALGTLPLFLDYLKENQTFSTLSSTPILESWGVRFPPTIKIIDPVLAYYLAHRNRLGTATTIARTHRSPS